MNTISPITSALTRYVDPGDETNPYHLQATKILIKEIEDLKARLAKAAL
jgi:hypothetical protein